MLHNCGFRLNGWLDLIHPIQNKTQPIKQEEDFSPVGETGTSCDPPMIEQNMDGTQTLVFDGRALDLPTESVWTLEKDNSGEYHVTSPNRSPKSVAGLMRLKRVREHLVPLVRESMFWGGVRNHTNAAYCKS